MSKLGWNLNALQNPASIHICITVLTTQHADQLLKDLAQCAKQARQYGTKGSGEGMTPIYGMASLLPAAPLEEVLTQYNEVVLSVE